MGLSRFLRKSYLSDPEGISTGACSLGPASQDLLRALSHPLRRDIAKSLEDGPESYSALMLTCGLDPNHDSGLFSYHLNELIKSRIVQRRPDRYSLTDLGTQALSIARSAEAMGQAVQQGGLPTRRKNSGKGSERRRAIDRAKKIGIKPVDQPTIRICIDDCSVEQGNVYWGLTKKTVGVDKVTALWKLHDGSTVFEVREPGAEKTGWAMHHLREDGLYTLGGVLEMEKDGQRAVVTYDEGWMGKAMRVYPLPLEVGRKWAYECRSLQTSTNPSVTGWGSIEGTSTYTGEVVGQYRVTIDANHFDCLLVREVVVGKGAIRREGGELKIHDPSLRVLMDRYLNSQGRLRLEYLWYTQEGGKKPMTREEAERKAGSNFEEMDYAGRTWYRVNRVPLDEPRPPEAKKWIREKAS